jgi:hypothetical protein
MHEPATANVAGSVAGDGRRHEPANTDCVPTLCPARRSTRRGRVNFPLGVSSRAEDDKYSGRVAERKTTSIVLVQNQIPSPKRTGPCEALRERPRRRRLEAAHGANRPQMNLCWAQD